MNQCFAQIPQIKGVVFVMGGVLKDANSVNDHKIIELFVLWNEMYMKSCEEEPTESSLAEFKVKKSSKENKQASNLSMQFKAGLENPNFINPFQEIGIDVNNLSLFKEITSSR
nr:9861_t:CDS:2 [Entrophospora candida]